MALPKPGESLVKILGQHFPSPIASPAPAGPTAISPMNVHHRALSVLLRTHFGPHLASTPGGVRDFGQPNPQAAMMVDSLVKAATRHG